MCTCAHSDCMTAHSRELILHLEARCSITGFARAFEHVAFWRLNCVIRVRETAQVTLNIDLSQPLQVH